MTKTCFTCAYWKADPHTLTWGKCHLFIKDPKPRKASEHCIFWREPGEIKLGE